MLSIQVPPLRERLEDLEALCEVMLERMVGRTGMPQRELARDARAASGNKTAAAQLLGVSRATLYEKLASLEVPLS